MVASAQITRTAVPEYKQSAGLFARAPRHAGDRLAAEVARRILMPPEVVRVYEWAGRFRTLATGVNAGNRYDPRVTPYAVNPMDFIIDPRVRLLVLDMGTQLGKTEIMINGEMYVLDVLGQEVAHILPGLDRVRDEARDRIFPSIAACRPLAGMMSGKPDDENARRIKFLSGASLSMFSSAALSSMKGRSIPKTFCDEVSDDRFDHAAVAEAEERQKAWSPAEQKIVLTSNQALEGAGIDHYARECGTQMSFFVPCPHCGTYQTLVFDRGETGLKWDAGDETMSRAERADLAERSAHYRCVSQECRQTGPHLGRIENFDKPWMLAMGVWVAADESIESDGRVLETRAMSAADRWTHALARRTYDEMRAEGGEDGRQDAAPTGEQEEEAESLGPKPPPLESREDDGRFGVRVIAGAGLSSSVRMNLSSLYSPFAGASFGQIARKFVRVGRITEKFVTDWLAEPWRQPGRRIEPSALRPRLLPSDHPEGYELGTLPAWARSLTMTADVQRDRCYIVVRCWGAGGLRTGLVWAGTVASRVGGNLRELDPCVGWSFGFWRDPERPPMRIQAFAADSADGYRHMEVFGWALRTGDALRGQNRFARSCRGDGTMNTASVAELRKLSETLDRGRKVSLRRPVPHMRVNAPVCKSLLYAGLGLSIEAESLGEGFGERVYEFPAPWSGGESGGGSGVESGSVDTQLGAGFVRVSDREYLNQITAEEFVKVPSKTGGPDKYQWRTIGGRENHLHDCEVYQVGLATAYKVNELRDPPASGGRARTPRRADAGHAPSAGDVLRGRR